MSTGDAALGMVLPGLVAAVGSVGGQSRPATPAANGYVSGVVQGPSGPEAGVWVIAQARDLPTPFVKIVVTDDRGRFMLPQLRAAAYRVWVRGYGLADSTPQQVKPDATNVTLRGGQRWPPAATWPASTGGSAKP